MLDVGNEGFGVHAAFMNEASPILHAPVRDCCQEADFAFALFSCRVIDSGPAYTSSMEAGHVQPAARLIKKHQLVGV